MSITKRPEIKAESEQAFIEAAPDAGRRLGIMRGKREQISLTMPPDLLAKADQTAQSKGITRAGLINLAVAEYLGR